MKKTLVNIAAAAALFGLFGANIAVAAEFIGPAQEQGNVSLVSTETHRNLYTAGRDVRVASATSGDLHIAGGKISVDGNVEQDAAIGGGEVSINAPIGGDVQAFGGAVTVNAAIGGDAIILGGDIKLTDKSSVAADLVIWGGNVSIEGPISGTVKIHGGNVYINSKIEKDIKVNAGDNLTFGSKAEVLGKVTYKGQREAMVNDGAKVGTIDFSRQTKPNSAGHAAARIVTLGFVLSLLAAIAAALLVFKLLPSTSREIILGMEQKPWVNLGIGVLGLIVTPIAAIILMVMFVGWYVALLGIFGYILFLMLAGLAASVYVGAWLIKMLTKKDGLVIDWQAIVIGIVVFGILKMIPVIGWIITMGLMLIAFGSMIRMLKSRMDSEQATEMHTGQIL